MVTCDTALALGFTHRNGCVLSLPTLAELTSRRARGPVGVAPATHPANLAARLGGVRVVSTASTVRTGGDAVRSGR